MILQKKFYAKVYDSDGSTFIKNFTEGDLKKPPTFTSQINGGFGECKLDLNLPFDDFDEGDSVDYMNIVKIYEFDPTNNQDGILIYTGFVSSYTPYFKGSNRGVVVSLLGLASLLQLAFYKDADFEVPHSGVDPSAIFKAIIDHFNTVYSGSLIGYDGAGTTIDSIGTNVDYTFTERKHLEALKDVFGVCGAGWWWSVDRNGQVYLKEKPATSTHLFTIGKDVESMQIDKTSEEIVNAVRVKYGGNTADDNDATSIAAYGRRGAVITDDQIQNATAAALRAEKEVDDNKNPKIQAKIIVNSQFNLESIEVGDTCKIRNFKKDSTVLSDNLQIVSVKYSWDKCVLELEGIRTQFGTELSNFVG